MEQIEIHAHPNFEAYGLEDLAEVMEENSLDVVALQYLNNKRLPYLKDKERPVFEDVLRLGKQLQKPYSFDSDSRAARIIMPNGKERHILRATEIWTGDNFHILSIGYDDIEPWQPIRQTIDTALKNNALVVFDHPYVDNDNARGTISEEQKREVERIAKEYSGEMALEINGYCIPWVRKLLLGDDVNKMVIELSDRLKEERYNVPVVTDTDVHAHDKISLRAIGTGRIKTKLDTNSGEAIVRSLRENIFSGSYENTDYKRCYVSFCHLAGAWGLPYLFKRGFKTKRD